MVKNRENLRHLDHLCWLPFAEKKSHGRPKILAKWQKVQSTTQ